MPTTILSKLNLTDVTRAAMLTSPENRESPLAGLFKVAVDDVGRHFTPYVLRHSYISWQLQAGSMAIHDIANQCGNSVGAIEKHYAKVDVTATAHRQRGIQDI